MSFNTQKQRSHLYNLTFMKWKVEERISEFEKTSIESTLAIHKFGYKADNESFKKLCESLSDFETMLEVAEETFPALRENMDAIKKAKMIVLKKHTTLSDEASKHEIKADNLKKQASNISTVIEYQKKQKIKSKGLKSLFGLLNY